jgi:hypothetical protein
MSTSSERQTFDPRRRLCPDGACIGLLDETGRCKECGMTAGGRAAAAAPLSAPAPEHVPEPDDLDHLPDDDEDAEALQGEAAEPAEAASDEAFDPRRRLCPDGDCLGVLGSDGRCPVCGRSADG